MNVRPKWVRVCLCVEMFILCVGLSGLAGCDDATSPPLPNQKSKKDILGTDTGVLQPTKTTKASRKP